MMVAKIIKNDSLPKLPNTKLITDLTRKVINNIFREFNFFPKGASKNKYIKDRRIKSPNIAPIICVEKELKPKIKISKKQYMKEGMSDFNKCFIFPLEIYSIMFLYL